MAHVLRKKSGVVVSTLLITAVCVVVGSLLWLAHGTPDTAEAQAAALEFYFEEDKTQQDITSATYVETQRFTVDRSSESDTREFFVIANAVTSVSNTLATMDARFLVASSSGTTTLSEVNDDFQFYDTGTNRAGKLFQAVKRVTLANVSHDFVFEFANPAGSNNLQIRQTSIVVLEESASAEYAENTAETGTGANTAFVDALSLTFTPSSQDSYMFFWSAEYKNEVEQNLSVESLRFRNTTDTVDYQTEGVGITITAGGNDNTYKTAGGVAFDTIEASSHTFKIQMDGNGSTEETYVRRAAIVAIPFSDFENVYSASQTALSSKTGVIVVDTSATTSPSVNAADHLVLGSAELANESNNDGGAVLLQLGSDSVDDDLGGYTPLGRSEGNDTWHVNMLARGTTTVAATIDFKVQFGSSDNNANREALTRNAYIVVAEIPTAANSAPSITSVTLRNQAGVVGGNITLVEDDGAGNGFIIATTTIDITDADGCDTINHVSATLYRTSTSTEGTTCRGLPDDTNCYVEYVACTATTTGDNCGAVDNTVEYDCGFRLWYIADPTATNEAGFGGDIWAVAATTSDGLATTTATNSTQTVEILTLLAHRVTSSISYGTVAAGADTGAINATTTVTVSGNAPLDTDTSCDLMCTDYATCAGGVISHDNQQHALAPFTYSAGNCTATTSPTTLETVLAKPTATTTDVTDDISWGLGVDSGQANGSYTGQNTLDPRAD